MRKFEPKPLKPGVDIGLKTSNPEGFWITPKTLRDISILLRSCPSSQGGSPLTTYSRASTEPFNRKKHYSHRSPLRFLQDVIVSFIKVALFDQPRYVLQLCSTPSAKSNSLPQNGRVLAGPTHFGENRICLKRKSGLGAPGTK